MVQQCGAALAAWLILSGQPSAGPLLVPAATENLARAVDPAAEAARIAKRDLALSREDYTAAMDEMTPDELAALRGTTADADEVRLETVADRGALHVSVDVARNRMTVTRDGLTVADWPVSTARAGEVTAKGNFRIRALKEMINRVSYSHNLSPMPHAMFYKGGYAIHGTYHTGMLGRRASAGCVRLSPKHAKTLFGWVAENGGASLTVH